MCVYMLGLWRLLVWGLMCIRKSMRDVHAYLHTLHMLRTYMFLYNMCFEV